MPNYRITEVALHVALVIEIEIFSEHSPGWKNTAA